MYDSMKKTTEEYDAELIRGCIGFGHKVEVDFSRKCRLLIIGKTSYIGQSVSSYIKQNYSECVQSDSISVRRKNWMEQDFSGYDAVLHVAGKAHADISKPTKEEIDEYYQVNTELAVAVAQKAKASGVRTFVLLSSSIVYGDSVLWNSDKVITEGTIPEPSNFYGDSKLKGEIGVRKLADESFHVIVIRSPMVYGSIAKGNYRLLARIARTINVFPAVNNQRSMLFIDNLCELICQVIQISGQNAPAVVLLPQNSDYVNTSGMVEAIAACSNRKIWSSRLLGLCVRVGSLIPGKTKSIIKKAFGNFVYDKSVSVYPGINYQKISFLESIRKSEGVE